MCISNMFPGIADAAGLGTTLAGKMSISQALLSLKKAAVIRQQVDETLSTIGSYGEKCILFSLSILISYLQ